MLDIVESIRRFNAGRDPRRLAMKYEAMRSSPFSFLRGTCHLFYARLPGGRLFRKAPPVWSCGDLHLENFGSYKGENRLVYFDISDFDEAALAPATWDPVRLLTSVLVAVDTLRATHTEAIGLCKTFIDAYANALAAGKGCWLERDTADGMVGELLASAKTRRRVDLLDRYTEKNKRGRRTIRLDGRHALAASDLEQERATRLIERYAVAQPDPGFFRVLDVSCRIAGTGSLGVERYIILIEGKGSPDVNYLLDLKQALPSSLMPHLKIDQPKWPSQAHRVVDLQRRMQAVAMAFLHPMTTRAGSYILRGLQPSADRVAFGRPRISVEKIGGVLDDMGRILAWDQLRSSGRQHSAVADELIEFATSRKKWQGELLGAAQQCAQQVEKDWTVFAAAYDAGAFAQTTPRV